MAEVTVTFRIPGTWAHPGELLERLPDGFRIESDRLLLPDGGECEFLPMAPDSQFAGVFASACRQPPTAEEAAILERYTVNIGLTGPGGSMEAALTMMRAAAALIRAGGAGVFIDNSALAHGGSDWIEMTEDESADAISYAFVSVVAGRRDVTTMGMHILGYPDFLIESPEIEEASDMIVGTVQSICSSGRPIGPGHVLADQFGATFQAFAAPASEFPSGSPLHNPFGRLRLVRTRDIAEGN